MATGGIFQLITNDGKQDRMLMATALLNKRLYEIEKARSNNPHIRDPTPTLVDIERTHILFMNAHFKPFAAIGYEYNRVRVQSGTARLGSSVQFSIPQFGDFFHDMVLRLKLGSVSADNTSDSTRYLSYVDFLGQRLVKNTKFTVNGNPLDEYDSDVYNFNEKFFITPNKQVGWNRNMGQEVSKTGFTDTAGGRGAGVREVRKVSDGPQTPKAVQPAVELWVPLLFWFNKDPRLSIPSVSIPYGQRFIDVTLARAPEILQHVGLTPADDDPGNNPVPVPEVELAELYINNIFVNPEIHDIYIKRIGFSLIRVHRRQSTRVNKSTDNILLNQLKWPIETMYVGLRPVDNIDERSAKMLRSWHIYAESVEQTVDTCSADCTAYSWDDSTLTTSPVSGTELTAAFRPVDNKYVDFGVGTPTVAEINTILGDNGYQLLRLTLTNGNDAFADEDNPTPAEVIAASPVNLCCELSYLDCLPTLEKLSIEAHGVPLYQDIPAQFFNSYVPYTYGGQHIKTPDDCGALMITFNLYPGSYQPSGHVNISRAREFYLNYTSPQVGVSEGISSADLVIVAIAINFLLISDGSAVLRYST